jgi:hypothetical protein
MVPASPGTQVGDDVLAGAGSRGGRRKAGGAVKSTMSRKSLAAASRRVRVGRFHFLSQSFSIDVWSQIVCET